jgi:hypothetical protein
LVLGKEVAAAGRVTVHDMSGAQTDHVLLVASIPYRALDMVPPPDTVDAATRDEHTGAARIKLPLSPEAKQQAKDAIEAALDTQYSALSEALTQVVQQQVRP